MVRRRGQVRTSSRRRGDASRPTAESTPAAAGTITAGMPIASARSQACSGPAPPKADQRETGRIDAAVDRHGPQRAAPSRRSTTATTPSASTPASSSARARRVEVEHARGRERRRRPGCDRRPGWRRSPSVGCRRGRNRPGPGPRRPTRDRRPGRRPHRARRCCRRRRRSCGRRATAAAPASPATSCSAASAGAPSRIRQTSVLVPPMSKLMASAIPARLRHRGGGSRSGGRPGQQERRGQFGRAIDVEQATGRGHDDDVVRQRRAGAGTAGRRDGGRR